MPLFNIAPFNPQTAQPVVFKTDPGALPQGDEVEKEMNHLITSLRFCSGKSLDQFVSHAGRWAAAQIDCTQCANCCKQLEADVTEEEIFVLSGERGCTPMEFEQEYIANGVSGERYLRHKSCVFLQNNLCAVYEKRPAACAGFPYIDGSNVKFRLRRITALYGVCPIVYNTIETLKLALKEQ